MIEKHQLTKLYIEEKASMMDIAISLGCSLNKVAYWMDKYNISRRSISAAIYHRHNPKGDPFFIKPINTKEEAKLLGIGIGLYWGEGNKANKYSVRLGNTDPALINMFVKFLVELCGVPKHRLRFGLQIFTDTDPEAALNFWIEQLGVEASQFMKIIVTISGSIGTYRTKSEHGVITVYFHNKKLRDTIVGMLPR